ncbi:Thylakoid lumenal 16.5 kDa protein [Thalictrum thalictroides]|uniref:Thylakoid lumenal 16.5 kDa protein n=1 Tax=Thalictrum thalictroides TaxID=46969 RepID=A0A7J6VN92_THATH|nr:Thylakoid lumenal 16.5 kDa protein [Thalictrum thalictroides]
MATALLSFSNTLLPSFLSSSFSRATIVTPISPSKYIVRKSNSLSAILCKASTESSPPISLLSKRSLAICLTSTFTLSWAGKALNTSNAAILEADDDIELLEKVKKDRKKRLERQEVISSSKKEAAYVQELVYKLSKVGQAIEKNDLTAASSVLGSSTDVDWVKKGKAAFTKLSSNSEEQTEVDTFNSSLASLISSVAKNDMNSSRAAFVSSASALEKWVALTGLGALLKGL